MHPLHPILIRDIRSDIAQMAEEGHDVAVLTRELDAAAGTGSADALLALQEDLWARPSPAGFPYEEPSNWETISAGFPNPDSHARFDGRDAELADRLLAAWQGRCAGCQLGKPLEGTTWPDKIETVLRTVGSWPLWDYMNPAPEGMKPEELPDCDFFQRNAAWRNSLCKGRFDHVAPDDDIHYALVGQEILRRFGPAFTSEQALAVNVELLPYSTVYAAGKSMFRASVFGLPSPVTARFGNPCRQSLGGMIRCDPFGWGAPANPALAARMAFTDAANSQTRNGIYSAVFFSVLMADALAHGDIPRAIETAAAYVPPRSRFAEMVRFVKAECAGQPDWQVVNGAIWARYPEEAKRFNHSIPNAAIVLMGLLLGKGDFTRSLGITVMAGDDTDCTGATAGSILGCALGTRGIPEQWVAPFHDTIRSDVKGMAVLKISEVARRMFEIALPNARR